MIALDATSVAKASNTLIPVARAKISARIAPGDDAAQASAALIAHLNDHAPWGAQVTVTGGETAEPSLIDFAGPYAERHVLPSRRPGESSPSLSGKAGLFRWLPTSPRSSRKQRS